MCFEYLETLTLKVESLVLFGSLLVVKTEDMSSRKLLLLNYLEDNDNIESTRSYSNIRTYLLNPMKVLDVSFVRKYIHTLRVENTSVFTFIQGRQ